MELKLRCIDCGRETGPVVTYRCECGGLLEVSLDLKELKEVVSRELFDTRLNMGKFPYQSGVWRFRELVHPLLNDFEIVSRPEGNTNLYHHKALANFTGIEKILLKHEGENPTGSFKDRGMTVGISEANRLGMRVVGCASTGNTSASLASYAGLSNMKSIVFIPEGKIAFGKLSQALAYGARVLQINGNFDDAMSLVQEASERLGIYLLNSINPFRIQGQKTIIFELIQQLNWKPPDWIVVPAGNLGNTSAFGKAIYELKKLRLIEKTPRIAAIQAEGANPFYRLWKNKLKELKPLKKPETIATAIRIGNPVSWKRALRAIELTDGVVEQVTDQEIMDAKAIVDSSGIGCEPASAASVAGARKLLENGIIEKDDVVVCIITGHILKDPDSTINYHLSRLDNVKPRFANMPVKIEPDINLVKRYL